MAQSAVFPRQNAAMVERTHATGVVLRIGLIAGTLDISENLIFNAFRHITPAMVFRYITSGLTGPWAFHAGSESIVLGAGIHYAIAMAWTVIFYLASRRMTVLVRRPVVCGLAYGALVYLIMNLVVLPRQTRRYLAVPAYVPTWPEPRGRLPVPKIRFRRPAIRGIPERRLVSEIPPLSTRFCGIKRKGTAKHSGETSAPGSPHPCR